MLSRLSPGDSSGARVLEMPCAAALDSLVDVFVVAYTGGEVVKETKACGGDPEKKTETKRLTREKAKKRT